MPINVNEVILDRVRSVVTKDLASDELLFRITSIEDPSLQTTAEGEEVVDAIGALITNIYRAKKATFSGSNSLISLDLASAQFGSKKEVADTTNKITDVTFEILAINDGKVELAHKPSADIKFIYSIESNNIGKTFKAGAAVSTTEFVVDDDGKTIKTPTGLTGKVYVEYEYETDSAVRVVNRTSEFPNACKLIIYAYFRDKCNENIVYSGKIICPKAKLNPEQIELALTSTGKHPFEFSMMKDYCAEEGEDELFTIIVAQ